MHQLHLQRGDEIAVQHDREPGGQREQQAYPDVEHDPQVVEGGVRPFEEGFLRLPVGVGELDAQLQEPLRLPLKLRELGEGGGGHGGRLLVGMHPPGGAQVVVVGVVQLLHQHAFAVGVQLGVLLVDPAVELFAGPLKIVPGPVLPQRGEAQDRGVEAEYALLEMVGQPEGFQMSLGEAALQLGNLPPGCGDAPGGQGGHQRQRGEQQQQAQADTEIEQRGWQFISHAARA